MKRLHSSLKRLAGTLEVKKLKRDTQQEYDELKKEIFKGADFPEVAAKVMVNKTLYTMDEILKYIQVFARLKIASEVLDAEGDSTSLISDLEEELRDRYPIHDNAPVLIGQAAQQVRNALEGNESLVDRGYAPIRQDPTKDLQ